MFQINNIHCQYRTCKKILVIFSRILIMLQLDLCSHLWPCRKLLAICFTSHLYKCPIAGSVLTIDGVHPIHVYIIFLTFLNIM